MLNKHTPAPWDYMASNNSSLMLIETPIDHQNGGGIHIASLAGKNNPQTKANAQLIAAAPELLEDLKSLLNSLVTLANSPKTPLRISKELYGILEGKQTSIAKAEGK